MKRGPRKALALLSIVAGFTLIWFEIRDKSGDSSFELAFWIIVAVGAIILGAAEIQSKG